MNKKLLFVFCSVQHHEIPPYNLLAFANRISLKYPTIFIDLPTRENTVGLKSFSSLLVKMFFYFFKPKNLLFWQSFYKSFFLSALLLKGYLFFFKLIRGYEVILYTSSAKYDEIYSFISHDIKIADIYDNPDEVVEKNSKIIAKYDKVFANSKHIYKILKKINSNCYLVSAAYHNYSYPLNRVVEKIPNTVVFYGGISHRINYEWIHEAVSKLTNINFFFIGQKYLGKYYVDQQDDKCEQAWNKILKFKNVYYWSGNLNQEMAQEVLSSFSLGIIPYSIKDSFNFNSHPMKLYDYLASNIPVLSSKLPVILEYEKNNLPIYFANNSNEFIKYIRKIASKPTIISSTLMKKIKQLLEKQSLETKFLQIEKIINE